MMLPSPIRSYLFVPGNRPDRIEKAYDSAADAMIIDLEDAVAESQKAAAREAVAKWLQEKRAAGSDGDPASSFQKPVYVRVHAPDSRHWVDDLSWICECRPPALMLAKFESADVLHALRAENYKGKILPLVESVRGVEAVSELAGFVPQVENVAFGSVDFALDLGVRWSATGEERAYAMARLVYLSRLAGLASPVDAAFPDVKNEEAFIAEARRGLALGYFGKLLIHPAQIPPAHTIFQMDEKERNKHTAIVEAYEKKPQAGVVVVDGIMVDLPVYEASRAWLAKDSDHE